jgi:branched-chain amino acid transport system ATP-binding protein
MLKLEDVHAHHGNVRALDGVSLDVPAGGIVTLLGANGAGKTSAARAIAGLMPVSKGCISFEGARIDGLKPERIVELGISLVPQGRLLFPELSVEDNLELGAYLRRDAREIRRDIERTYARFPILGDKRGLDAGTLSGGQQQMLALARSMMSRPRLLILDEPSLGLAPRVVEEIFTIIRHIRDDGTAILLVEQNAGVALEISDRAVVLEAGRVAIAGTAAQLLSDERVQHAYLGSVDP